MRERGDDSTQPVSRRGSRADLPPGVPRLLLPGGKLGIPVTTMLLKRTRDWMQNLLDHHVPPLTREDVLGFGVIDCVGAIDPGDKATAQLPYPSLYDTASLVHIVAEQHLEEVGWTRSDTTADDRLMDIVRHAQRVA